ncbi:MAG: hypothetical protein GY716_22630 [bacterium]|nr:hypothetical protein [bacterium]
MGASRSGRRLLIALIVVSAAYSLFLSNEFEFNNVDDAYIAFRYGRNLMDGHGPVFNPGERVEGYTSPLWTLVMAPFTRVGIDIVWFSIAFGLAASIAALVGLYAHARRLVRSGLGAGVLAVLPLVALDNTFAFWAVGGMETPLFTALVLWGSYVALVARSERRALLAGLLLGLATLTRPEGLLIAGCVGAHRVLFGERPRRELAALGLGVALPLIPHVAFRLAYYGTWLPNTFHNKVDVGRASFSAGLSYLLRFLQWRYAIPLLALPILALRRPRSQVSLHVMVVAAYVAYIVAVGGDWPVANRFFAPILPMLYLLVVVTLVELPQPTLRRLILAACVGLVAWGTFTQADSYGLVRNERNVEVETQRKRFGMWLKDRLPTGTLIAVGPAGAIPYYSELPAIDMWGLADAHIALAPRDGFEPGHDRSDLAYVLSRDPVLVVGYLPKGSARPHGYLVAGPGIPDAVRPREPVFISMADAPVLAAGP